MYAWTVSLGYLTGGVATVVLACYVIAFQLFIFYFSHDAKSQVLSRLPENSANRMEYLSFYQWMYVIFIFALNAIVTVSANVLFLLNSTVLSGIALEFLQFFLVAFKYCWSNYVIGLFISTGQRLFEPKKIPKTDAMFRTILNLFSVMLAPCIASAIAIDDCFYYIFFQSPIISAQYSYLGCALVGKNNTFSECSETALFVETVSYKPIFTYSYQCSSALMTEYSPVFIYFFIACSFLQPALRFITQSLQLYFQNQLKDEYLSNDSDRSWKKYFYKVLKIILGQMLMNLDLKKTFHKQIKRCYSPSRKSSNFITMLCVITTFGCAFPPLGIIGIISLTSYDRFQQIEIGRLLLFCDGPNQQMDLCEAIDRNFKTFPNELDFSINLIIPLSCMFMSLFILDTMGDERGIYSAIFPTLAIGVILPVSIILLRELMILGCFQVCCIFTKYDLIVICK
jgi:hypothetical protein